MGKQPDVAYWKRLFERGVDGTIWTCAQPDMWTEWDANEVRYGRNAGGPRSYHRYMVSCWLLKVVDLSVELGGYRLAELLDVWQRMASADYTTDGDHEQVQPTLARARAALVPRENPAQRPE